LTTPAKILDTDIKTIKDWKPHFANYTAEQQRVVILGQEKMKEWESLR
jgi:hypothetical protein